MLLDHGYLPTLQSVLAQRYIFLPELNSGKQGDGGTQRLTLSTAKLF